MPPINASIEIFDKSEEVLNDGANYETLGDAIDALEWHLRRLRQRAGL
jgi:hypothetical protein